VTRHPIEPASPCRTIFSLRERPPLFRAHPRPIPAPSTGPAAALGQGLQAGDALPSGISVVAKGESGKNLVAEYGDFINLLTMIIPDFINEHIFIFHDLKQYYGIKNWQTSDSQQFPVPELVFSEGSRLFFKKIDSQMTMLYVNQQKSRIVVFLVKNIEKMKEYPVPQLPPPLLLEYFKDHSLLLYYPDQYIDFHSGKKEIRCQYQFNNYQSNIIKILLDMNNGQKLFFNDSNKLFSLFCDS